MAEPHVRIGILVQNKDRVFLLEQADAPAPGTWSTPTCLLDSNETLEAHIIREADGQTGLTVRDPRFVAATIDASPDGSTHSVTIWMRTRWISGEPAPTRDRVSNSGWFDRNHLPTPLFTPLENLIAGRCYPPPSPGLFPGDHAARVLLWPTLEDHESIPLPAILPTIVAAAADAGFTFSCDTQTGALLRTLAASKPAGNLLEIGTGVGAGASWLLSGMSPDARLTSVEVNPANHALARAHLSGDPRITLLNESAADFIVRAPKASFDLIFADTWIGKNQSLDETLALLKPGGFYVVDDMLPMHGWGPDLPRTHPLLAATLQARPDLHITRMCWSTGLIVCVKI
jgi:predicted O-methyltransferase YrrM/ADP-ribose pyrophosphatase YjhB (NUDIX family)